MTISNQVSFEFPALKSGPTTRKIEVQFSSGEVTSDAGVMKTLLLLTFFLGCSVSYSVNSRIRESKTCMVLIL